MSINAQIDVDGDLVLQNGNLVFVDDMAQRITCALRMLYGEWFLDISDGTPYLEQILVQNVDIARVRALLSARILGVEGVTGLKSLILDLDKVRRTLTVDFEAYGPGNVVAAGGISFP